MMQSVVYRGAVLFGVALFMLAGCSVSSKQDGTVKAQTRKGGFLGLSERDAVEVDTAKAFAGRKQVVVGSFKVGFNVSKRMQQKAGSGFGGKSTGLVKLEGVSPSVMQKVTDQAYTDFLAELKAAGYTVVDRSRLTGSATWRKAKTYDFPYTSDQSGFLSEYGQATWYAPSALGKSQPVFMGEIQGVTGGFGHDNANMAAGTFGKESGIPVVSAAYFVDFAGAEGHGGGFSATSSLKVGQLLAVDRGRLSMIAGHGGSFSTDVGYLDLGQPVASQRTYARIEETSTGVDKGVETAANVFSAVLGGGTNQTRKFVYHADATKYQAAAVEVLKKANDRFTNKMAELR